MQPKPEFMPKLDGPYTNLECLSSRLQNELLDVLDILQDEFVEVSDLALDDNAAQQLASDPGASVHSSSGAITSITRHVILEKRDVQPLAITFVRYGE